MTSRDKTGPAPGNPELSIIMIPVDALRDGMLPASDVKDSSSRLLCKAGTPLRSRDARFFKSRGVTGVQILVPAEHAGIRPPLATDPEAEEQFRLWQEDHFRFAGTEHEVLKELHRLCHDHYTSSPERLRQFLNTVHLRGSYTQGPDIPHVPPFPSGAGALKKAKHPSLPEVVIRLNEAIDNPRCTATHIADIISKDAALTARLLRLVNSPLYNFPNEITSIPRAVAIAGSRQLSMMAVATVVTSTFQDVPSRFITMESFWKHSIACGVVTRLLAVQKRHPHPEVWFLAGLLHDIGRLIIFQDFPAHARLILQQAETRPGLLHLLEDELLGLDHARLGGALLQFWKLSETLEHGSLFHHSPNTAEDPALASAVHLADIIVNAMSWGCSGEWFVPPLNPEAWSVLALPASAISAAVSQTHNLLQDIMGFYIPSANHESSPKRPH